MNLSARIKQLAENKGVTMYTISQETGISQSTLSRFITGKGNISRRSLKILSDYFYANADWLATGKGDPYAPGVVKDTKVHDDALWERIVELSIKLFSTDSTISDIDYEKMGSTIDISPQRLYSIIRDNEFPTYTELLKFAKINKLNIEWLILGKGSMLKETEVITLQDTPESGAIPYYSDLPVSAGERGLGGIPMHEKPTGWIKIPGVIAELGAFPVVGCSMEPNIHAGDFIAVSALNNWDRVDPDKIYLIITVDERMIKHLMIDNEDTDILWCISPNYPKFKIYKAEIKFIYRITFHGKIM